MPAGTPRTAPRPACDSPWGYRELGVIFFFLHDPATTEIYTLSLHDALPISRPEQSGASSAGVSAMDRDGSGRCVSATRDRKSTRLNSSHSSISYAVFCL